MTQPTTSVLPACIDALVTTFTDEFTAEIDAGTMTVIDGPYIEAPSTDYLCIGWAPGNEDDVANGTQDWAAWGSPRPQKSEDGQVICYLDAASGATGAADVKARRGAAYDLLARIENRLRADAGLGGALGSSGAAKLTEHHLRQEQTGGGFVVGITFTVEFTNVRI